MAPPRSAFAQCALAGLSFYAAAAALLGCSKVEADLTPAPEVPFPFVVSVGSDGQHPVSAARVVFKTRPIASSDAAGLAQFDVTGNEGDSVSFSIQCPDGFASPEKP